MNKQPKECTLSRRDFFKTSAFLGGTGFLATTFPLATKSYASQLTSKNEYPYTNSENILYSSCLQCTTACSIKTKIHDGVVMKIDGNPYSPMTFAKNIPYELSPEDVTHIDGKLCAKGQAGIQHVYDPYRVRKVLKRNGPRGSNEWITIPFDQAIEEIVNGGKLFSAIGEDREVEGLKDIYTLRDAKVAKEMAADIAKIRKKEMTVKEFQDKHRDNLHVLIDPEHPDKGPKNNQFLFQVGRIHNGRKEFTTRFVKDSFGSVNWIEKTTLCSQTVNKAWTKSTSTFENGKWTGGVKTPRPDHANTEFLIVFGSIIFEANYGPVQQSEPITEGLESGRLKLAVVDPRMTKVASKAWKWVPMKPGGDGAFGLGMIRWILENERYDKNFLQNSTAAAAKAAGEPGLSDATYLVKIEGGRATKQLRADEIGIGTKDQLVVLVDGKPVAVNPNDSEQIIRGELFVDALLETGIQVKTPLQLIKEQAYSKSVVEWAEIAGAEEKDIVELAREFTSYGKKACVEFNRGVYKHTNGWHAAQALIALNILIGNFDWKGGTARPGGGWTYDGSKEGQQYPIGKLHTNKLSSFGIPITKEGWQYEESTLFSGYPAKRPWYPFSGNVAQETWPAINDEYPYPMKAVLISSHTPIYSIPGGQAQLKTLLDVKKVPLLISCDIVIGDTSMYADYIFPDVTYLERWGTPQQSHHTRVRSSHVRQPVIAPLTDTTTVFGEEVPLCLESLMMAVAEKLNLSGFGKDAFAKGSGLYRPEDYYFKLITNIAYGNGPGDEVPDANETEMELFRKTRSFFPKYVFDEDRWKKTITAEEWKKFVYIMNRGGRFQSYQDSYDGDFIKSKFKYTRFYIEDVANARHSMTGEYFYGYPIYEPIKDSMGNEVKDQEQFQLVTYKEAWGTQSRTISNYWGQLSILPENYVVMNKMDADALNISDGDMVRVTSTSNPEGTHLLDNEKSRPIVGKVQAIQGIRPGVIGISTHFGHWGYGSNDVNVDNQVIKGDARRGLGIHPNPLFRLDEHLNGTPLSEPIGGSVSFFDSRVNIRKV
ncbi:hypothetical protein BHU72_07355 [Desulfuribacillus stibiiarsenatis]|uniref:4Fe-4S Mo/W bis-MGD-type domain-containing protein n=1 Tax=Desulfuribacillus stibiiarsenatis TaxID=1390249 RepID=A0A1E5L4I2_9FIRM|nr:molybdopterin-dependent oxidoreductase [Desulfuribacillus stibiiarsenatis]OEH84998.1 hypothetical protein BHU72_07355 [Desulfuribacillus stibiiarsenatis]